MIQTEIEFSRQVTEEGIQRAVDSANRVHENWSDKAYDYLLNFVKTRKKGERFLIEDVRQDATTLVPHPPSYRAWGAIARRAIMEGVIVKVGYRKVKNSRAHQANAAVYIKGI